MAELTKENFDAAVLAMWKSINREGKSIIDDYEIKDQKLLDAVRKNVESNIGMFSDIRLLGSPHDSNEYLSLGNLAWDMDIDLSVGGSPVSIKDFKSDDGLITKLIEHYLDMEIYKLQMDRIELNPHLTFEQPVLPEFLEKYINKDIESEYMLVHMWDSYVIDKIDSQKWKENAKLEERQAEFRDFVEIIGGDQDARNITKIVAKDVRSKLLKFPKNRRKLFGDTPLNEIPENAETISARTANERLGYIRSFFQYLENEEIVKSNPFKAVTIDATSNSYATYDKKDIKELFNLPPALINKSWQFWIPRVALLTGARQGEIAQLLVSDVKKSDEGIWYFDINDEDAKKKSVKTSAAVRKVPIHKALLEHGFLEFHAKVVKSETESLWPDLKLGERQPGRYVSQYWRNLRDKHKILSSPKEGNRQKVFHSLRRFFINEALKAENELQNIQALVGHEPSMGVTAVYVDEVATLGQLKRVVDSVVVEGVSWEIPPKAKL